MRYRIGELAEFFGMTKEGVRYLERQGVIRSERDERNGYRYFPREEITRLKQIRHFQSIGFSLEEAQGMVCDTPRDEIEARMSKKLQELEEKETQLRRTKTLLTGQLQIARRLLSGGEQIYTGMRPELLFFPRVSDEASIATQSERAQLARDRAAEKAWILAAPPCVLGAMHDDGSGRRVFGSIVSADRAEAANLPIAPRVVRLEPCLCVCGVMEAPIGQPPDVGRLLAYARENRLERCGDIYGILWLNYRKEGGARWGVHEVFMPVRGVQND